MNNITISIFGNQIFSEVIKELELFSKYKILFYKDFDLCLKDALKYGQLVIFFITNENKKKYENIKNYNFPLIVIAKSSNLKKKLYTDFSEQLNIPFSIFDLHKKVVALYARYEFKKSSIINLGGYIVDKNERKIKKNDLEMQLTEKEVNFLILFSENSEPVSRNYVLKNVWNYSLESDTHTVETHIHRLRKKILDKFKDDNFIKNNEKGYYI